MGVTATDPSRRQFLRGDVTACRSPLRPPWAMPERHFTAMCTRCEACVNACEQGVIAIGSGGFPEMVFARAGCTFCGACLTACEPRALHASAAEPRTAWSAIAAVAPACLAANGIVCRACAEVCEPRAIGFRLLPAGRAVVRIDGDACTACGACLAVCPVAALTIESTAAEVTS
jgi:ferredoxin-type protein NapF